MGNVKSRRIAIFAIVLCLSLVLSLLHWNVLNASAEEGTYSVKLVNACLSPEGQIVNKKTYTETIGKEVHIEENIFGAVEKEDESKYFGGYYTEEDGKGTLVTRTVKCVEEESGLTYDSVDTTFTSDKDITLYAYWDEGVTLTFDANGGKLGTETQVRAKGIKLIDPSFKDPTRKGYIFKGWSESKDGKDVFQLDEYIAKENTTLYAVWEADTMNGLMKGPDGKWAVYKDGKVDTSFNSVVEGENGWYRVKDGYVDWNANGIYQNEYGWWKTTNGKVTFKENGVFQNGFGWWRVKDSKVDFKAQGIYQNQYGWWKTKDGKVTFDENGVFPNELGWWKVENSKVNFGFTGIANNEYGYWYLQNGKVRFDYDGLAQNSYGRWYFDGGKLDWDYDGEVEYKGITYTCTDGKVTGGKTSAETNAVKVLNSVGWDFKKAYYWTINNITYNKYIVPVDGSYGIENYANHGFVQRSGNCYTFGCCVYYLGRMCNEDIHAIKGTVPLAAGGYGPHCWNEVTRNGKKYVLDAKKKKKWRKAGKHPYSGWLFTYGTKGSLRYNISHRMD